MVEKIVGFVERRWALVIAAGAVIGALLGLIVNASASDVYVARSLVVLTEANIPPEEFSDVATAMFPTDAVLRPVIRELGLDRTPGQLIASGTVALEPEPGGLAVSVVARANGPDLPVTIANATAAQLADVSEVNGIGNLAEFHAEGPATVQARPALRDMALGAVIGALVAALDVAIVLLLRRRSLATDGRFRFEAMVRADVTASEDENQAPVVTTSFPLATVLGTLGQRAEGGPVVATVVDGGRDLWASLAVADELARLAKENGRVQDFRVLPVDEEPTDQESSALVVIARRSCPVLAVAGAPPPATRADRWGGDDARARADRRRRGLKPCAARPSTTARWPTGSLTTRR